MTEFTVRPMELERDAGAVADLTNAAANALEGRPPIWTESDFRSWVGALPEGSELWVAAEGEALAGCADATSREPGLAEGGVCVAPEFLGQGLGSRLLDLTESWATGRGMASIRQTCPAADEAGRRLLEGRGYRRVRSFFTMGIEVPPDFAAPEPPTGIAIGPLRPEQERAVHAAIAEAFADDWSFRSRPFEEWRKHRIEGEEFDADLFRVASDGEEVAGVALCVQRLDGWVENLAVRPGWRKRGLGIALLDASFAEFARRGQRRVVLGVDAENPTGATRLYERAGMQVELQSDVYEKELSA